MTTLSACQRDILIEHMDGNAVAYVVPNSGIAPGERHRAAYRHRSAQGLLAKALIRFDGKMKPTHTYITEKGREALCAALADWAEAIVLALDIEEDVKEEAGNDPAPFYSVRRERAAYATFGKLLRDHLAG